MLKFISLFLVLITGAPSFAANWTTKCERVRGPITWDYCVSRDSQSQNPDVVYQLHGAGQSERTWSSDSHGNRMREAWITGRQQSPTVVSISFGKLWLLTSPNSEPKSGLYDFFVQNVMPYIESRVPIRGRRLLFGYSMGGYNSAQLYLKNPELFSKVVVGCPAMATISPYASAQEITAYQQRTGANSQYVRFALKVSRDHYPSDSAYQLDNPISNAKISHTSSPPLHISCGDRDQFGFQEGAKIFADAVSLQGANVSWTLLPGQHCQLDETSIAQFLVDP